jgi:hypothetical protein
MWFAPSVSAVACVLSAAACHESVDADQGSDAELIVLGAQFVRAPLPPAGDGPATVAVELGNDRIARGVRGRIAVGTLGASATAALVAREGDRGHWVVVAGPEDIRAPGQPTLPLEFAVSRSATLGARRLLVQAVDARGAVGAPLGRNVVIEEAQPVGGRLVVSLAWDRDADLDLHVEDPLGRDIHAGDPNSYEPPPPGEAPDPDAWKSGGKLDFDSNAQCEVDGRRVENVIWDNGAPPAGRYKVRVHTASLCGEQAARYRVTAWRDGVVVGAAQGTSVEWDTRSKGGRGAGVLAFEFDVPRD